MLGLLTPPCLPLSLTPSPPPSLTPPYSLSEPLPAFLSLTPPSLSSLSDPPLYLSLCLSVLSHICQGPDGCREAELRSRRRRAGGEASGKAPESGWRDETRTPGALKLQANLRCFVGPFPPMSLVSAVGGQGVEALGGPPPRPLPPYHLQPAGSALHPCFDTNPKSHPQKCPPPPHCVPECGAFGNVLFICPMSSYRPYSSRAPLAWTPSPPSPQAPGAPALESSCCGPRAALLRLRPAPAPTQTGSP